MGPILFQEFKEFPQFEIDLYHQIFVIRLESHHVYVWKLLRNIPWVSLLKLSNSKLSGFNLNRCNLNVTINSISRNWAEPVSSTLFSESDFRDFTKTKKILVTAQAKLGKYCKTEEWQKLEEYLSLVLFYEK